MHETDRYILTFLDYVRENKSKPEDSEKCLSNRSIESPIFLAADKIGRSSGSCYKGPCMSCTCGIIGPGVKIMNISKNGRSLC